jgi:hydrogenase maturation protease
MIELAEALGRLPERLVVVGVEGECFDHGEPLSPSVAEAVPAAVERVGEALSGRARKGW